MAFDRLKYQRETRRKDGNKDTRKYEKTISGFLMRTHRNMRSRVSGIQHFKAHLYKGLEVLSRKDFYEWAKANKDFQRLYRQWVATGYDRKLTPSINRIDTTKGYVPGNMEWLTHSMNSALGAKSIKRRERKTLLEVFTHAQN